MRYIIKNITEETFVSEENNGNVEHTEKQEEALVFNEEWDAESTLEMLNDTKEDCYSLVEIEDIDEDEDIAKL